MRLGVWRPKNLRSQPKAANKITYHYYPLHLDAKTTEGREVDVTFRLALIAKALGWSPDLHLDLVGWRVVYRYYYPWRHLISPASGSLQLKVWSTRFC